MSRLLLLPAVLVLLAGCDTASTVADASVRAADAGPARQVDGRNLKPDAEGLAWARSRTSVAATVDALLGVLAGAPPSVVAVVDHAANAARVGLTLPPTQVVVFGAPALGTPLMQRNQTAGIDLPQKILVYENAAGQRFAAYNTTDYLADRHGLDGVATLPQIAGALETFTEAVTIGQVRREASAVALGAGLVTVPSAVSVAQTVANLEAAIASNPALSVAFVLDHAANAASAGLTLRPTTVVAFGNPRLGTPLMQAEPTVGIDLPQKMLAWEDADGHVFLTYNDPFYVAARHGLTGQDERLQTLADALAGLAAAATSAP